MATHGHRIVEAVHTGVITASDTRTIDDDVSGALAREILEAAGHEVAAQEIVPDEPAAIRAAIAAMRASGVQAIVTTGGTGIAPRDRTYEAVSEIIERELPGFGELFRSLSYAEIGSAALLSRAVAGVADRVFIACLPGSAGAVRLGLEKLIVPELGHIVGQLDHG